MYNEISICTYIGNWIGDFVQILNINIYIYIYIAHWYFLTYYISLWFAIFIFIIILLRTSNFSRSLHLCG